MFVFVIAVNSQSDVATVSPPFSTILSNPHQLPAAPRQPTDSLLATSSRTNDIPSTQSDALIDFSADSLTNHEAVALLRLENDSLRNRLAKQEQRNSEAETITRSGVALAGSHSGQVVRERTDSAMNDASNHAPHRTSNKATRDTTHEVKHEAVHEVAHEAAYEVAQALRVENAGLQEQVALQARELEELRLERESLLTMLRQLQDDLNTSEQRRTRSNH